LIALFIAFGTSIPGPDVPAESIPLRLLEIAGALLGMGLLSFGLGGWVAARVSRQGYATGRVYRRYTLGSRLLTLAGLGTFAWILYGAGWPSLVLSVSGLRRIVLLGDLAVLSPYVLIQLIIWSGLYFAERVLHDAGSFPRLPTYLGLKARQAVGLVLPVVVIFVVRNEVLVRYWPDWHENSVLEPLELVALGFFVLAASPLFIRLAWPTRSLPDGPLRRRLEHVARRAGFRFNDLLIWDTRHLMVNACVTGVLPWFRYVLLSDALLESLSPVEVAAVFGHELGHVAHRHLPFFGFFFVGSLGVLSLAAQVVSFSESWLERLPYVSLQNAPLAAEIIESGLILALLGVFFWFVFGQLSRRFERQADVFGCKVVSCGIDSCPPHLDLEEIVGLESASPAAPASVCPVGVQIFAEALASVARQNGIDTSSRSWRHGSINYRLAFLRRLQADPRTEQIFQRGLRSFCLLLSALLLVTLVLAAMTRSWELLR
jgi:STE24 endopeptidase